MAENHAPADIKRFFNAPGELSLHAVNELLRSTAAGPSPFYDTDRNRWIITDGEQIRAVLAGRAFTNDLSVADSGSRSGALMDRIAAFPRPMLFTDEREHSEVRRAIAPWFRRATIAALQPGAAAQFSERLQHAPLGAAFDFGAEIVGPTLTWTLLQALGFDEASYPDLLADSFLANRVFDLGAEPAALQDATRARVRVRAYIADQLERLRAKGDDLTGRWDAAAIAEAVQVSNVEAILRAGAANTGGLLLGVVHRRLTGGVLPPAPHDEQVSLQIEHHSPVLDAGRVCRHDIEVGEQTITAGQTAICLVAAPGRARTPSPAAPSSAQRDLAFGGGRHVCLGAPLVRMLVSECLGLLDREGATLSLAGAPHLSSSSSFFGITELPVTRRAR